MVPADPDPDQPFPDLAAGLGVEPPDPAATILPPAPHARRPIPFLAISFVLVAILAGSALFMSGYTMGRQTAVEPGTPRSEADAFQPFWDTYHTIGERYAGGDVDRGALIQGAIKGMIDALDDPYSSYMTSDEYRSSLQGINGQFEGIGAEIATEAADGSRGCAPLGVACRLIVTPLDGSPAARAGVRAGDIVVSVDGNALDGLTVDAARDRIRGPRGTVVTLTVQRGAGTTIDVMVTRDVVQRKEVTSEALAGGTVGYIRLDGFSDAAADEVVTALSAHLDADRTKLILDLRGNPGGFVTAARKIASQFIGSGPIFWEQDAKGGQVPTDALGDGVATSADLAGRRAHRRWDGIGERDRGGRTPGHKAGDARRPAVVRQGDRAAVAGTDRRGRCVQADHRPLVDPGQALDPQGRAHTGRRGELAATAPRRERSDPRARARGARRIGRRSPSGGRRLTTIPEAGRVAPPLRSFGASGTVPASERR